jgi:hypothetical protein
MRRKHFTNWTPYLNVLNDWSSEYRFFAKHVKTVLNLNLLNYSYISFNTLRLGAYSREFATQFSQFKGASALRLTDSYFQSCASNKLSTSFIKHNTLLYVNSRKAHLTKDDLPFTPLYLQSQTQVYAPTSLKTSNQTFSFIQNLGLISNLAYQKELYKVLVLLCLSQSVK